MRKNDGQKKRVFYDRIFKIAKKKNSVDLSGSLSVINNKASKEYFDNESFQITFSTKIKDVSYDYTMLVTANESIEDKGLEKINYELGIQIEGCGMYFEVLNYKQDFSIQFDTYKSVFIDTPSVKNGVVYFSKNKTINILQK